MGNLILVWIYPFNQFAVVVIDENHNSDRYSASLQVTLSATDDQGNKKEREVTLMPLPHPSPLNQQYYAQFPQMLQQRLESLSL